MISLTFKTRLTELNTLQFSIILFVVFLSFFHPLKIEKINKSWKLVALKTNKLDWTGDDIRIDKISRFLE